MTDNEPAMTATLLCCGSHEAGADACKLGVAACCHVLLLGIVDIGEAYAEWPLCMPALWCVGVDHKGSVVINSDLAIIPICDHVHANEIRGLLCC